MQNSIDQGVITLFSHSLFNANNRKSCQRPLAFAAENAIDCHHFVPVRLLRREVRSYS